MVQRPYSVADGVLSLAVRLTPKGGRDAIDGVAIDSDGRAWLAVRVSAPAETGKANKAMIKLLAKRLGVPQSAVTLAAGATHRHKRVRLTGDEASLAAAIDRLSRASD